MAGPGFEVRWFAPKLGPASSVRWLVSALAGPPEHSRLTKKICPQISAV